MFLILFIVLTFIVVPVSYAEQFHFQLENDVTFGEDGNYSNGMIFGWESIATQYNAQSSPNIKNWQQVIMFAQSNATRAWGLKVSQRMWTPEEIKVTDPQPLDRPYAGFLEFEQHVALYSSDLAQKSWFSLGVIGPASGTEQLQGSIHKLLGASTPEGWSYQIENTATVQLAYEVDYLLFRHPAPFNSQWEISAFNHNSLGNFRSDINVGLTLRWGANLEQSFGRLSSHFGHVGNQLTQAQPHSLLFFTRTQVGHRFNDLTIDGDLPYDSQVEFNPHLASVSTGLIYSFSNMAVTWSFNFYNKEYLNDDKEWHGYGLLQFSWAM